MDSSSDSFGTSIHSGFPNPATDASLQSLNLHTLLVPNGASTYLMRIAGNAWEADGVFDGDIAVVDRALVAAPNDMVVWWRDDEFAITSRQRMPHSALTWGVVTSIIHQYRKRDIQP